LDRKKGVQSMSETETWVTMEPPELLEWRRMSALSRKQAAEILSDILERPVSQAVVNNWESAKTRVPDDAAMVIRGLRDGQVIKPPPSAEGPRVGRPPKQERQPDESPLAPEGGRVISLIPAGTPPLEEICTEMWLGIGGMIELMGAMGERVVSLPIPGTTPVQYEKISLISMDGRIVRTDAEALGKAWARLAQQNAFVERILRSMSTGGAWIEVAFVTSQTMLKVYSNHIGYVQHLEEQKLAARETVSNFSDNGGDPLFSEGE
jgi:hypothetical protein